MSKMPKEFLKDSLTKTYGIRSGEPKRPESLIEMPSMVPEVPEVSLCFNQEKNQPLQPNKASNFEVAARDMNCHHNVKQHQNEMLHRDKYESYNTWRAKHSQALHDITSGVENVELASKRGGNATKRQRERAPRFQGGIVRKQNAGNEIVPPAMMASKYYYNQASMEAKAQNNSSTESIPQINTQQVTANQSSNSYPVEQQHTARAIYEHPIPSQPTLDPQLTGESYKNPRTASNFQNHYSHQDRNIEHVPNTYQNSNPVFCVPNYCNKPQCSCGGQNTFSNPSIGNQFCNGKPILTDDARVNMQFPDTTKMYSPLQFGLMNSHLSNLFQIINIQKEQISMLCQEMSAQKMILSSLFEEVKQVHAAVSPNSAKCNTPSSVENNPSQPCNCDHKKDQNVTNKTSKESESGKTNQNGNSTSNLCSLSPPNVEKRSVAVMTSSLDNSVKSSTPFNGRDKAQEVKENVNEVKKQKSSKSSPPNKNKTKQTNKKAPTQIDKKKKPQSNHTQRRKSKKEESNESSQSEESFSLDEAAVVVRNEPEQTDVSPEVSIHVNMPDYSASSESDSSNSSDSEDEGRESGTEGESSDPQIGWTFYDRVVGQVNNMLKKPSNDPRQDHPHNRRKNAGNVLYQCNEDYETENNWSKRVTFDGPPLEESDNNGFHAPRYHNFRGQDYRMPGPERVQDFLMCDYANANGGNNLSLVNGSTNVSFATYRYYQRHQLLPPPPPPPEQMFPDPTQKKKKNKSKKSEKTPPMNLKSSKRRSGGPPSKILDMSALKHQPKLF